jgi:hypothetical protein
VSERSYTDEELNAAIEQLTDPAALRAGQDLVMRAAPSLQRVLATAMSEGGWFDSGHRQAVREVAAEPDADARVRALETMLAEETRLGMLVGVAVGFELSRRLDGRESTSTDPGRETTSTDPGRETTSTDPDPSQED